MITLPDPTLPLLLPDKRREFKWAGRSCAIHPQRDQPGSTTPHAEWFYLELPDGSVHEVQACRLRYVLEFGDFRPTAASIALAFAREPGQSIDRLSAIAATCGLR